MISNVAVRGDGVKYLAWIGGILSIFATTVYGVFFTPLGNSLIKPMVENKIREQTKLESKLTKFSLATSSFEIVLALNENNSIKLKGDYSLFLRTFDFSYEVALQKLESLEPFTLTPLRGTLYTNGTVKGDIKFMKVDGKSDIGDSHTAYYVELTDLNPTSIIAKMKDAKLSSLLNTAAKNPYATADIDLEINFKNINPHMMDGDIVLKSKNGNIDPKYMKSDFNVTIPKTSFSMNLDAKLKGDDVDYKYDFSSNLFKISTSGRVVPQPLKTDIKYSLDIQELEALKPITGADIRGALKLEGEAKGDKERLTVSGISDLASSESVFEAVLKDFELASLRAKIENLEIEKLLFMLKQPHYTDGLLSMNADISDARSDKLDGKITTKITKGLLNSNYLTKVYEFKSAMPTTTFDSVTTTILNKSVADSKVDFNSNIANIDIKSAKFDIKDGSLKGDYTANIVDLSRLSFITNQHLRGALVANGEFSKAKDLDFTMHSNIADGKIYAKLHNDNFYADIGSVKTKKLLYMFLYPEILDATLNAKLNYDLTQSRGTFNGQVANAKFEKNQPFDLVKQYVKFDMYKEFFSGDINAKIYKENVLASLDLRSIEASINIKEAKINTKTKQIDSDITLQAKKNILSAALKGDIDAPRVSINLEEFMKTEAGKEVQEKISKDVDRLIKKLLK